MFKAARSILPGFSGCSSLLQMACGIRTCYKWHVVFVPAITEESLQYKRVHFLLFHRQWVFIGSLNVNVCNRPFCNKLYNLRFIYAKCLRCYGVVACQIVPCVLSYLPWHFQR